MHEDSSTTAFGLFASPHDIRSSLAARDYWQPSPHHHLAEPHRGLHLVQRNAPDPHAFDLPVTPPLRTRLEKAVDMMLGRAEPRGRLRRG